MEPSAQVETRSDLSTISTISDASSALVELTEPDGAFIHTTGTLLESAPRNSGVVAWIQEGLRGEVTIEKSRLPKRGRYQIRVMAIDKDGKGLGYFSYPRDIVYNPQGFGAAEKPSIVDFNRLKFDTRPDR